MQTSRKKYDKKKKNYRKENVTVKQKLQDKK